MVARLITAICILLVVGAVVANARHQHFYGTRAVVSFALAWLLGTVIFGISTIAAGKVTPMQGRRLTIAAVAAGLIFAAILFWARA